MLDIGTLRISPSLRPYDLLGRSDPHTLTLPKVLTYQGKRSV